MSTQAQSLVNEQVTALSTVCDLEPDVMNAFRTELLQVAERHFAAAPASTQAAGSVKLTKKGNPVKPRATKPKEDKIPVKNAYHIFVAAKMMEVKNKNVAPKERMGAIGTMWKDLDEAGKAPYQAQAAAYNAYVTDAVAKDADWKSKREEIQAQANAHAGTVSGDEAPADVQPEAEEEAEEETEAAAEPEPAPVAAAAKPKTAAKSKAAPKPKA